MVRKQLYVRADQEGKLKRLAKARRITQAELVRQAIDQLPEQRDGDDLVVRLEAAGLLLPRTHDPALAGVDREEVLADVGTSLKRRGKSLRLTEGILEQRERSPY